MSTGIPKPHEEVDLPNLRPCKEIPYGIDRIEVQGDINGLTGTRQSFKSFLLLDLCVCAALPVELFGEHGPPKLWGEYKINNRGGALYLNGDDPNRNRLPIRLRKIIRGYGVPSDVAVPIFSNISSNIDALRHGDAGEESYVVYDLLKLQQTLHGNQKMFEEGHPYRIVRVVFDSRRACFSGDENSSGDAMQMFAVIRSLAQEFNITPWLIHHHNKTGGNRGSSVNEDQLSVGWTTVKDGQDLVFDGNRSFEVLLKSAKQRDFADIDITLRVDSDVSEADIHQEGGSVTIRCNDVNAPRKDPDEFIKECVRSGLTSASAIQRADVAKQWGKIHGYTALELANHTGVMVRNSKLIKNVIGKLAVPPDDEEEELPF